MKVPPLAASQVKEAAEKPVVEKESPPIVQATEEVENA